MLKRIRIKGYKSLNDVEVELPRLAVLMGPNAAGKSNLLDALLLLSKLGTSKTLKDAFAAPYRGKPLESFSFGEKGIKGLLDEERLGFSLEADLHLSDGLIDAVNRHVREMRRPSSDGTGNGGGKTPAQVHERDLRYRIEVEMLPKSGILRVSDEYLAALNAKGEQTGRRKPFIERHGDRIRLRLEGQAHPTYYDRYLDHTILSMPHYPPHYPHLVAARRELENWLFFYFEPREHMRAANPVKEVRHIGLMGEELPAFLNTLKALDRRQFEAVEKALHVMIPDIEHIEVEVSDLGEVELRLKERGIAIPARVLSEGTLRLLGLLALAGVKDPPALVGFEEPENGVHPRRIQLVADLLKTRATLGQTQYIVTTHSPVLADLLPDDALLVVGRTSGKTRISRFSTFGPLGRKPAIEHALDEAPRGRLPVSERLMRGDFDA